MTSLVVFILIAVIATPAVLRTFKSLTLQKRKTDSEVKTLYEDEDGVATEQSQNQYSSTLPRYVLLASMMVGLSIALGDSVYSSVHSDGGLLVQCWITFGSWVDDFNPIRLR